jgi:GT2 family glycosyltransferase
MSRPEVSLIVTTFQMPGHLERVLASVARQTVFDRMEVIVTDDGSADETPEVVSRFSRQVRRHVRFVTHRHDGFHLTRCRNDGVRLANAPYLLLLDGDCVIPPDHVEQYLKARREGVVHFGYCCRLDQETSERIDISAIESGEFAHWTPRSELRKLAKMHYKSLFYQLLGHKTKPALKGGNIGIWREDYERLNGFDENFKGWGCEDDDLSYRARAAGLKVASILGRTRTYHLWHPPAETRPSGKWSEGTNVAYLKRRGRLTACVNGLAKRQLADLRVKVVGIPHDGRLVRRFSLEVFGRVPQQDRSAEIELLFHPGQGTFSKSGACRVLVASDVRATSPALRNDADLIVSSESGAAIRQLTRELKIVRAGNSGLARAA